MSKALFSIYLAGEIHSDWREKIRAGAAGADLPVCFFAPITDHNVSDGIGVNILGAEEKPFWQDHQGASINGIRTRTLIEKSDIVVVSFGEQYRQWSAAFDAGMAVAFGKPLIVLQWTDHVHALKEVNAAAHSVAQTPAQVVEILAYITQGL